MVELLTMLMHMLDMARHSASARASGGQALSQLVLILADGRFHEKESLRRVVEVHFHIAFPLDPGKRRTTEELAERPPDVVATCSCMTAMSLCVCRSS